MTRPAVHQFDLQHAIDHCDNEHVLEINITDFLQGVCGHLRGPSTTSADPVDREDARTPTGDTEGGDGDEKKRLTCVPFNKVDARIKKCSKLFDNHEGIKKKFSDLLQVSGFKLNFFSYLLSVKKIIDLSRGQINDSSSDGKLLHASCSSWLLP